MDGLNSDARAFAGARDLQTPVSRSDAIVYGIGIQGTTLLLDHFVALSFRGNWRLPLGPSRGFLLKKSPGA